MDYFKLASKLKQDLNNRMHEHPKRLRHIHGVATCMEDFASFYQLNVDKALIIAYLHDFTKKEDTAWHLNHLYKKDQLIFEHNHYYLHALSAVYIAKEVYEIQDISILDAIRYHCTGYEDLDVYAKLMIIADVCEPNRKFKDKKAIYQLTLKDIELAYAWAFEVKYQNHIKENQILHPWFIKAKEKIEEKHVTKN
jgi:nicotinate-nucleotide adenylyltransferase